MEILRNLWYMFRRFKVASILNFIGLTIAFAAFFVFMTQVDYNNSYNKGIKDHERIYRLELTSMAPDQFGFGICCSRPHAEGIAELPQVEAVSCYQLYPVHWEAKKNGADLSVLFSKADNKVLSPFSPRCLDGKLEWTDEDRAGVLIPASMAMLFFDEVQVAGRYMYDGTDSVLVRGVYEDFPENSSVRNIMYSHWGDENKLNPNNQNYGCFVKLRKDANVAEVEKQIRDIEYRLYENLMKQEADTEENREYLEEVFSKRKARLNPMAETYFSGTESYFDKGNKEMMMILEIACLLVLLVAAINFLNFTLAESPMRIKGINTRLVLGKGLWAQRMELVCESIVVSLFAFAVATGIVYLISEMPEINELMQGSIAIKENWGILLLTLAASVITAVGASMYPAFYATSFAPALVLKGSFGLSPKGKQLRTILVAFQMIVSFFMVSYIGVLFMQSRYIFNSDYGFDKEQVFFARLDYIRAGKFDELTQNLKNISGVESISRSRNVIGTSDSYSQWGRGDDDHTVFFEALAVDWQYLRTLGIKVIEGRDFNEHDGDVYIINETARKQWDWVEMDKPLIRNDLRVVGVCENIRFGSVRQDNASKPMAFVILGETYQSWGGGNVINIRVAAGSDKVAMRKKLEDCINKMEGHGNVNVSFLDKELENTYKEEFRFISQVVIFSIVCLLITLIGVFCLTMFETEYRRKEIGIRKIMGSSVGEILLLLCRKYATMIAIAFVIAAPAAWYFGNEWLKNFAERTEIHWWLFPVSLLIVGCITLLTVIIQSWKTANENPINSIKTE